MGRISAPFYFFTNIETLRNAQNNNTVANNAQTKVVVNPNPSTKNLEATKIIAPIIVDTIARVEITVPRSVDFIQ